MLDHDDDLPQLERMLACLDCGVELPDAWQRFFDLCGPLPTSLKEDRSYPRFHYRGRAVVKYLPTLPALPRSDRWFCVFTKDVSRSGLSFLHCEQIFPQEVLEIWLPGGSASRLRVIRATLQAERCYEIGTRFQLEEGPTNGKTAPRR